MDACVFSPTVHKSQGSTYRDDVWLDLGNMGRNTKTTELKRLVYVAITRTGSKVYVTGALPERYGQVPGA